MRFASAAVLTTLLAYQAAAHGTVTDVDVDGVYYAGYEPSNDVGEPIPEGAAKGVVWAANDKDIGFVLPEEYGNPNIICHKAATPAPLIAKIAAGGTISLTWRLWPTDVEHPGVFLNYLAPVENGDLPGVDKTKLKFFKISQFGFDPSTPEDDVFDYRLATAAFKKAGNVAHVQIPATIKAGIYVLRHEIIALHEAEQPNGAQNYPQCINLEVTGSGTATPGGILGTQLYKPDEPGILVKNLYVEGDGKFDPSTYQLPGPPLWDGASSGPGPGPGPPPAGGPTTTAAGTKLPTKTGAPPSATTSAGDDIPGEGEDDPGPDPPCNGRRRRCDDKKRSLSGNNNNNDPQNERRHARDLVQE